MPGVVDDRSVHGKGLVSVDVGGGVSLLVVYAEVETVRSKDYIFIEWNTEKLLMQIY